MIPVFIGISILGGMPPKNDITYLPWPEAIDQLVSSMVLKQLSLSTEKTRPPVYLYVKGAGPFRLEC